MEEEDKKYSVYIHTNTINNKKYVGMTSVSLKTRWGRNGSGYLKTKNGKYCQPAFANAILKYGWDVFTHEVIASGLTFDEASDLEIKKIAELKSDNAKYGYNIEKGGRHSKVSEQTLEKMKKSQTGKKHSEETKKKISQSNTGKTHTAQTKECLSEKHSKIKQEPIENIIPNYQYNEVCCRCVETGICYHSISTAAKSVGSYSNNIAKCLTGKRQRAGGYHWEKITNEEYEEYIHRKFEKVD